MLVEASASICATGYNQDLRRESIRFLQNSIDFYRFSWILIDFHVFRGVDAKVIHEKPPEGLAPFLAANFIAQQLLLLSTRWSNRVQGQTLLEVPNEHLPHSRGPA